MAENKARKIEEKELKIMRKKGLEKLVSLVTVGALAIGVFTGCGASGNDSKKVSAASTTEAASKETKKVVIAGAGVDSEGNVSLGGNAAIARDQGFLEEELKSVGYEVEYVGFQTAGVGANEALAAKEADVAIYGDFPAVTYIASGNDARIFAGDSTRNQLGIFAQPGIESVADLKGKKVCTMLGTTAYLYLIKQLKAEGLGIEDIEVVNSAGDAASLYIAGEVDAIVNGPQLYWGIELQGGEGKQIAVNGDSEELSSYNVVIGRTEYLNENPEVEQAIVKALDRAYKWANENEQAVYDVFAKSSGAFTADHFKNYYSFEKDFSDMDPVITDNYVTHLQEVADFLYDNQLAATQISIGDFINKVEVK